MLRMRARNRGETGTDVGVPWPGVVVDAGGVGWSAAGRLWAWSPEVQTLGLGRRLHAGDENSSRKYTFTT